MFYRTSCLATAVSARAFWKHVICVVTQLPTCTRISSCHFCYGSRPGLCSLAAGKLCWTILSSSWFDALLNLNLNKMAELALGRFIGNAFLGREANAFLPTGQTLLRIGISQRWSLLQYSIKQKLQCRWNLVHNAVQDKCFLAGDHFSNCHEVLGIWNRLHEDSLWWFE